MNSLLPILICIGVVIAFGSLLMGIAKLLGISPASSSLDKSLPYECGLRGEVKKTSQVSVQFYLTAILFILFDIEIIFLYPWALTFNDFILEGEGWKVLLAMGVFLLIFIYGLIWEIFSKALQWK